MCPLMRSPAGAVEEVIGAWFAARSREADLQLASTPKPCNDEQRRPGFPGVPAATHSLLG
jgi:hypothetical protein